jgi:hypothetical protein
MLKIINCFRMYNLFMDDQYYWVVCLRSFVLRVVLCGELCRLFSVQVRGRVVPVLAERGGLSHRLVLQSILFDVVMLV